MALSTLSELSPRLLEMMRLVQGMRTTIADVFGSSPSVVTEDASTKSMELLKRWLSPEQQQTLDKSGYFDVIGGDTGIVYNIRMTGSPVYTVNVVERENGVPRCRLCFGPHGVPHADKMLAQMIALQNMENEVRREIANFFTMAGAPLVWGG